MVKSYDDFNLFSAEFHGIFRGIPWNFPWKYIFRGNFPWKYIFRGNFPKNSARLENDMLCRLLCLMISNF